MTTPRRGAVPGSPAAPSGMACSLRFAVLCLLLCGCHRRQTPPTLPAVVLPPDVPPPTPTSPMMETAPPASITTAPEPVKVTEAKPKRRPKKTAVKAFADPTPAPPVETAVVKTPQPLGELSAGGESTPKNQQEANELITLTERRLAGLPKTTVAQQETQTRDVQHFLQQARQALASGDIEGAKTLATKAKLLMDDLEKWSPQP